MAVLARCWRGLSIASHGGAVGGGVPRRRRVGVLSRYLSTYLYDIYLISYVLQYEYHAIQYLVRLWGSLGHVLA